MKNRGHDTTYDISRDQIMTFPTHGFFYLDFNKEFAKKLERENFKITTVVLHLHQLEFFDANFSMKMSSKHA